MRLLFFILFLLSSVSYANTFSDLKFSQEQVADTQWDMSTCGVSATCNLSNIIPGTAYKIPWESGQLTWALGDYIQFTPSGDLNDPWTAKQYNAAGDVKDTIGNGRITNIDNGKFMFIGGVWTGQLFSSNSILTPLPTMTLNGAAVPAVGDMTTLADMGSIVPLISSPVVVVPPPTPKLSSLRPLMIGYLQSSANTPGPAQDANMALDGNIATKYLNFDKFNTGFTVRLSAGKVVTGLQITTAEDYFQRDPASFTLYGSNDNKTWTTITLNQAIALPDARNATSDVFNISNVTPYVYYKIEFPTLKDMTSVAACAGAWYCNSMQIAELVYIYDENNPLTSTDTGTDTFVQLPGNLCCGASAAQFNANPVNLNNVMNFKTLSTGSSVYIDQYGVNNTVYVEQVGSKSNGVVYVGNGLSNDITITQTATNDTQTNYVNLDVNGNSNTINIEQYTANLTSFTKGAFVHVIDNNNQVAIQQKDEGNHYASVSLSGGYKTVNILQQGAASHMADVTLSGQPTSLSLQQSGATQQFYSINFNCTTAGGCQPIQVQQGQ